MLRSSARRRGFRRDRRRQRRLRRSRAAAPAGHRCAAGALRASSNPAPTCASASASACASAAARAVRARGLAGRAARGNVARRAVRQRSDRRAADAALRHPRRRGVRGTRGAGRRTALSCASTSPADAAAARPRCATSSAQLPERRSRRAIARELLPQLPYWIQAVSGVLQDGAMLFVDYGYPRREYYLPRAPRRHPASPFRQHHMTHRRVRLAGPAGHHRLRRFHRAGRGRHRCRLRFRRLLLAGQFPDRQRPAGATWRWRNRARPTTVARHALRQQVKRLTLPGEMGERFQVMGFQRGVELRRGLPASAT